MARSATRRSNSPLERAAATSAAAGPRKKRYANPPSITTALCGSRKEPGSVAEGRSSTPLMRAATPGDSTALRAGLFALGLRLPAEERPDSAAEQTQEDHHPGPAQQHLHEESSGGRVDVRNNGKRVHRK